MTVLDTERHGSALVLTMNRPEARNALSNELVANLREAVRAAENAGDVRGIVITGAGDRAFSAGTDLKERATLSQAGKGAQSQALLALSEEIWRSSKPVVAAIFGWCLGGGLELALACDLRIAAEDARFGFPEMRLGAYPGSGGPVTLTRLVGAARAKNLLFTARDFNAREAEQLGILQRVVPREQLSGAALAWIAEMEATGPLALAALKRSINLGLSLSLPDAAALDQALRRPLDATQDYAEGMQAHFEKRRAIFSGR
ncbi:enoyl-CoA hydratase/isomerase family protein [Methylobacterium sp. J-070]|uniref:enoyl-CoA hydratase/isomerase family protein n=1 Tax=Methylobacterium sp. J-070 TaxID=2836650 RepID=UPI001FBB312F|nr:enoyl-CoA hydratase/isomerase family protein [Methylobacterium sp. J-070]MCJ2052895.1 enoyl-CoA hydratase/isomerase family protein [Methylobacterium sp. J-070]